MSTKVPLEQPADDNDVMFLDAEAGGAVVEVVVVVGGRVVAAGAMEL